MMKLSDFNREYEKVLHSNVSKVQKTGRYSKLMTDMEREFKVPILRNVEWEKANKATIALYRKISLSRGDI